MIKSFWWHKITGKPDNGRRNKSSKCLQGESSFVELVNSVRPPISNGRFGNSSLFVQYCLKKLNLKWCLNTGPLTWPRGGN